MLQAGYDSLWDFSSTFEGLKPARSGRAWDKLNLDHVKNMIGLKPGFSHPLQVRFPHAEGSVGLHPQSASSALYSSASYPLCPFPCSSYMPYAPPPPSLPPYPHMLPPSLPPFPPALLPPSSSSSCSSLSLNPPPPPVSFADGEVHARQPRPDRLQEKRGPPQ